MKFTEDMIGKWVREISTGDTGIICGVDENYILDNRVRILWKTGSCIGTVLTIDLSYIEFIDPSINNTEPEEITINGIRYKLTRIKE